MKSEDRAESLIRRDLDAGRTPAIKAIAEEVGLTAPQVNAIRDRMLSGKKPRLEPGYRDPGRVVVMAPAPPVPAVVQGWRQGLDHPVKRIATKAARVRNLIADLEHELEQDASKAELRAQERELAARLEEVRAQLRPKVVRVDGPKGERVACPDCDKFFKPAGLGIHRGKAH